MDERVATFYIDGQSVGNERPDFPRRARIAIAHRPNGICSDSELLVKQLSGEYKVKEERLRKLWEEAKELMNDIGSVRIQHVPREKNLAGLWLEGKIKAREMAPEEFLSDL